MARFIQYKTKGSEYDGPFDNKSGWAAAGMGDVLVTENGRIVVIDGGFPDDAEDFVNLIESQTSQKTPEIDFWIITHPHIDHYGVIQEISQNGNLRNRIVIKQIIYWFPSEFCNKNGEANILAGADSEMTRICELMNASSVRPARDDKLTVDDIEVEFLYVPDDCSILNTAGGNSNYCSLIFTVKGKARKAMITGDAYRRSMEITAWRYADRLKCDILQMPHHALCDAYSVDFYRYVDPQIVFMPISVAGYRSMHSKLYDKSEGAIANLCVEAKAKEVYKAFNGTAEVLI